MPRPDCVAHFNARILNTSPKNTNYLRAQVVMKALLLSMTILLVAAPSGQEDTSSIDREAMLSRFHNHTAWMLLLTIRYEWDTRDITSSVWQLRNYSGMSRQSLAALHYYIGASMDAERALDADAVRMLCGDGVTVDQARWHLRNAVVEHLPALLDLYDEWKFRHWISSQQLPAGFGPRDPGHVRPPPKLPLPTPGVIGSEPPVSMVCQAQTSSTRLQKGPKR